MPEDRLIHATERLRIALRQLHKADHPDIYTQLRALDNAGAAAFVAASEISLEHKYRLRNLREKLEHAEKVGGTDGEA